MAAAACPAAAAQAASEAAGPGKVVQIANYLCPGNYAVSGAKEACEQVEKLGKSYGARYAPAPAPAPASACRGCACAAWQRVSAAGLVA